MDVNACLEPMTGYVSEGDREPTSENTIQSEPKYAGSSLETMTGKDGLKSGIHKGLDMNHILSLFNETILEDDTGKKMSHNKTSDNGIDRLPIHKCSTSFDQTEDYGGMDVNDCLQPWNETISRDNTSAEKMIQCDYEHLGASFVEAFGLSPTQSPCQDTNRKKLKPVPLSAVGMPAMAESCTPPLAKTGIEVELDHGAEKSRDKLEAKGTATWDTDVDFDLNDGSIKMSKEDFARLNLQGWYLSDACTGLPPIDAKEDMSALGNARKMNEFSVGGAAAQDDSRGILVVNTTGIDLEAPVLPVASTESLQDTNSDPVANVSGITRQQGSLGNILLAVSPELQPPNITDKPQANDFANKSSTTSSEHDDESSWVKLDMATDY
jgi:hypothetical protein